MGIDKTSRSGHPCQRSFTKRRLVLTTTSQRRISVSPKPKSSSKIKVARLSSTSFHTEWIGKPNNHSATTNPASRSHPEPTPPKLRNVDLCRAACQRQSNSTREEQAYVAGLEKKEIARRQEPVELAKQLDADAKAKADEAKTVRSKLKRLLLRRQARILRELACSLQITAQPYAIRRFLTIPL